MKGPDLIEALEREGFVISRRSKSLVWLKRGDEQLMLDSTADVDEALATDILTRVRAKRSDKPGGQV